MCRWWLTLSLVLGCLLLAGGSAMAQGAAGAEGADTNEKLRILVDKVMQPEADWTTEEWMVRDTAEAGFNVYSPRRGYDDFEAVRQVTEWCAEHGIRHIPWMRGSEDAPAGEEAEGQRLVWESGYEQPVWSPNSDGLWEWMHRYIVEFAKISAEHPELMGVFLDFENYGERKEGNYYRLSYDDAIWSRFAKAQDRELPDVALDARKAWLEEQGLHEAFEAFQVEHWRERCRELREAVDAHNPAFQFCIYPAPGTPFMVEAAYQVWSTPEAPLILADASTYGRPSRFMRQEDALEANRQKLLDRMQTAKDADIPFVYAGGIDPVVRGADPEFSGKNAVAISSATSGYWVFYEGVSYTGTHRDYWKWFTWANKAIQEGRLDAWKESRETAHSWLEDALKRMPEGAELVAPATTGKVDYPRVRVRREGIVLLSGEAGKAIELDVKNEPVGSYQCELSWELWPRSLKGAPLKTGTMAHGEAGTLTYTPENSGLLILTVSAGSCAFSLQSSNVPAGFFTGDYLNLFQGPNRLYFRVPEHAERVRAQAFGAGQETVRVALLDPEGDKVAAQETRHGRKIRLTARAEDAAGKVWSLETSPASEGAFEDHRVKLDATLPPVVSLVPEHAFGIEYGE